MYTCCDVSISNIWRLNGRGLEEENFIVKDYFITQNIMQTNTSGVFGGAVQPSLFNYGFSLLIWDQKRQGDSGHNLPQRQICKLKATGSKVMTAFCVPLVSQGGNSIYQRRELRVIFSSSTGPVFVLFLSRHYYSCLFLQTVQLRK